MRLVYICSSLLGDIEKNIQNAHDYCKYAADCGVIPLAPHTVFTHYLHGPQPEQGVKMGLELLKRCDEIWVMGSSFTEGMRGEMKLAEAEHIPILYIPDSFVQCGYKIRQEDAALTAADSIPGSDTLDYDNQILVLKPEAHRMGLRMTADDSLWLAEFGNGCRYGAIGRLVMATSLLSGERVNWSREDFFGIVAPNRLMAWSADKPVCNDRAQEVIDLAKEMEAETTPKYDLGYPYLGIYCMTPEGLTEIDLVPTPENIAAYIATEGRNGNLTILTPWEVPFLTTIGTFVDRCIDQEFLQKLLPILIPMQQGEIEPPPVQLYDDAVWAAGHGDGEDEFDEGEDLGF